MSSFISKSESETIKFSKSFASKLHGGEVILLIGDLGAGKTTFVKGLAEGLGVNNAITSPTFVLMKTYQTKNSKSEIRNSKLGLQGRKNKSRELFTVHCSLFIKNLVHIDTYRGLDINDLEAIGALEYFGRGDTICCVEWGEGLERYLRERGIKWIAIKIYNLDKNKRKFEIN